MQTSSVRVVNAVSSTEMQRRWAAVRAYMRDAAVDALVMQNSSDWVGGYIRWFSNQPATNGYSSSLVFPLEGLLSLIEQGPFGGVDESRESAASHSGIGRRLTSPSYPSVCYTGHYDADIVISELKRFDPKRVGIVAPGAMYHSFGVHFRDHLRTSELIDATDAIDRIKALKSDEEQRFIRQVAAMQDAVMARVREYVRPGLKDFEVAAFAQYQGELLGSEQGIFLCSSAPAGHAATFRPRSMQGRTMERGDTFSLLIENNGGGGFYTELSRIFVLGKASSQLKELHAKVIDAQAFALTLLRPGSAASDIFARHNDYLVSRGMPEERRLSIHGMGYDMVERPLIRSDEDMQIEKNMSIVCHPGVMNQTMFVHNTDNYLIAADGPSDCLHQTPKTIFEV